MNAAWIPLYVAVGIVTGICSGLFGIGGGVILVPFFVYAFGFSQTTASGVSLTALLLPVGILGVLEYWRAGKITGDQIRMGLMVAGGMFIGTYLGARLAVMLPTGTLRRVFSVFLALVAVKLWLA